MREHFISALIIIELITFLGGKKLTFAILKNHYQVFLTPKDLF